MASGVHRAANGTSASVGGFELGRFAIDELRPLRVVVIGAGYSGIIAGLRVPQRIPNVELVIYEKLAGVGGVWFSNKYPGVACDIPSHSYQLTFEPNPHWSAFYAPGSEIQAYLKGVVDKYKLMRYIKLNHELTNAIWDSTAGKWNLTLSTLQGDIQDAADIVINCTGVFSQWKWPDVEGLFGFNGRVVHSAQWNLEKEGEKEAWEGKNIAVIGVGSSAIQIVPRIQPKADKVANFVRGKTWISVPFASDEIQGNGIAIPDHFTEAEHREFEDPEYYAQFRHKIEEELNTVHGGTLRGHPVQLEAVKMFREAMVQKLEKPGIAERLIPDFPVSCRRLTPGPGYLEALNQDNVELVTETIKRVTPNGIETADGKLREFDIIVCATGFDTTWKPPYTVIGRDGLKLQEKWSEYPLAYLGIAIDGFPNWFLSLGPNSGIGSGSLLVILERQIDYITAAIAKLQRERLKTIEVKTAAVKDFDEYLQHYFPQAGILVVSVFLRLTYCYQTVYSERCASWYKMGKEEGRVAGLWPGSCLHAVRTLAHPRWEDFNYEPLDGRQNRFYWLGDGWTVNEREGSGNRAWYLDEIDYPPVPE
ncbi:FAD/NAD(P)-binding domain-containing protein [Gautieria morchelliformis]|nr:FAD/NAD(P)-binding domain-containing protein [Gautieria morchelliformis]